MVSCFLLDGRFESVELADLTAAAGVLESGRWDLHKLSLDEIIELLSRLGKELVKDPELSSIEGASYTSLWLRRDNLERLCALNYTNLEMMDRFCEVRPGLAMRAQPRGISCHWLPNNVATLSVFSLMLGILSKNASILKVSDVNRPILTKLLRKLGQITIEKEGRRISGETIVRTVMMISFESSRTADNEMLSKVADVKIVWGSSEAVRGVVGLPQKDTCDTLVFGPKYSMAVFDQSFLARADLPDVLKRLALDTALFNQSACTSPQVAFIEQGDRSIEWFAEALADGFRRLPDRLLKAEKPEPLCINVIAKRGEYLLAEDKGIMMSKDLSWTILIDDMSEFPEPVQGRCIFIRPVQDLDQVLKGLTKKIQTIALCIDDPKKLLDFADKASYAGVDRFVMPGEMNDFTLPWDGLMPLNRMVKWSTIRRKTDDA